MAFPAAEPEMDLFRRLLASLGLRAGEAAVPGRDPPEPPLARPELGPRAVLHPLDLELDVLVAEGTVTADTLGHLHGGATEHRYRGELLFEGSWVAADFPTRDVGAGRKSVRSSLKREHSCGRRRRAAG